MTYVTLPTVAGDSSTFLTTFYLVNGPKQPITLPKYVLKPNTITKVTATIDPDQPGNIWKVNVNSLIDVDVEWKWIRNHRLRFKCQMINGGGSVRGRGGRN